MATSYATLQSVADTRLTAYQWRLFVFLGVATFFEGYDFMVLANILPNLRADLHLSETAAGWMVGAINGGTVIAYLVIRRADRWGRKPALSVTIAGYTIFTFASGLAPDAITFTAAQFLGRVFLVAEWGIATVYAAEEYPARVRGTVIGVLQGLTSLGAVACAGAMPFLLELPWGWRSAYLIAVVPLLLLAYVRRGLRESPRYQALRAEGGFRAARPLTRILKTPYRARVLQLGLIWCLTFTCSQTMLVFWKDFAVNERSWTDGEVARAITIGAVVAMPFVFLVGKLLDTAGRRFGAALVFSTGVVAAVLCYTLEGHAALTAAVALGVFSISAYMPVLNTYTTELFPTDLRADAVVWSNNLLGRVGYVIAPIVVGSLAATHGWAASVRVTAVGPLIALVLILALLPETRQLELEETSRAP